MTLEIYVSPRATTPILALWFETFILCFQITSQLFHWSCFELVSNSTIRWYKIKLCHQQEFFLLSTEGLLVNKGDLQASYFSGNYCHSVIHNSNLYAAVTNLSETGLVLYCNPIQKLQFHNAPTQISNLVALKLAPIENILAMGQEGVYTSMTHMELQSMKKYGNMYFGDTALTLHFQLNTSCLGTIYSQDYSNIKTIYPAKFLETAEQFTNVGPREYVFYTSTPQALQIRCPSGVNHLAVEHTEKSGYQIIASSNQKTSLPEQAMTLILILQSKLGLQPGTYLDFCLILIQQHWQLTWPTSSWSTILQCQSEICTCWWMQHQVDHNGGQQWQSVLQLQYWFWFLPTWGTGTGSWRRTYQVLKLLPMKKQLAQSEMFFFLFQQHLYTKHKHSTLIPVIPGNDGIVVLPRFYCPNRSYWHITHTSSFKLIPPTLTLSQHSLQGIIIYLIFCVGAQPLMTQYILKKGVVMTTEKNRRCNT